MAISWDVSAITDKEALAANDQWPKLAQSLAWLSLIVGIESIARDNWREFYRRTYTYEKLTGPMRHFNGIAVYVTAHDVYNHIGLKTKNVTNMTGAEFEKQVGRWVKDYTATDIKDVELHNLWRNLKFS